MIKMNRLGLGLLCLLAVFCCGAQAQAAQDDAALCYYGAEGYLVAPPAGWVNLAQTANEFGLCGMYAPDRTDFHSAPALIYPRVVPLDDEADPAQALLQRSLERFKARPDGVNAWVERGNDLRTAAGLDFAIFYLNDGPSPNQFELLACHVGRESMLIMVLSATGREERESFIPDFARALEDVYLMRVQKGAD